MTPSRLNTIALWLTVVILGSLQLMDEGKTPLPSSKQHLDQNYSHENSAQSSENTRAPYARTGTTTDVFARVTSVESSIEALSVAVANLRDDLNVSSLEREMHMQSDEQEQDQVLAEFRLQLARYGIAAEGLSPDSLHPLPPDASLVGSKITQAFEESEVRQFAQITNSSCQQDSCTVEVSFYEPQSALEKEDQLISWLMATDPACSFQLDSLDPALMESGLVSRTVRIDCQYQG